MDDGRRCTRAWPLTDGAIALARRQADCGVEAVLISRRSRAAGFIGVRTTSSFVLPYERRLVAAIKEHRPNVFVYTHTCGASEPLDLMMMTGSNGIDTLDPPPRHGRPRAGQANARRPHVHQGQHRPREHAAKGDDDTFARDVRWRLQVGKPGGGYILSSACSVAPRVRPERLALLADLAEQYGRYE